MNPFEKGVGLKKNKYPAKETNDQCQQTHFQIPFRSGEGNSGP